MTLPSQRSYASREDRRRAALGISEVQFGNPLPTFNAYIRDQPGATRVIYPSSPDDKNNVYWDTWDPNYDTRFFDTGPYEQTNDPSEGLVIAGVGILVPGLYAIHALIDWDLMFTGFVDMASNYDDGQFEKRYHDTVDGDPRCDRIDHFRYFWANPDVAFTNQTIEIVVGQNGDAGDLTIPGGQGGAWGNVPTFEVTYLGGISRSPGWMPVSTI